MNAFYNCFIFANFVFIVYFYFCLYKVKVERPEANLKTDRPEDNEVVSSGGGEHALRGQTLPFALGSHSKAALPLPASTGAEVPLSLAIMVDDSTTVGSAEQRDKQQLFDEPASKKLVGTNDNEEERTTADDGVDHYTRYDKAKTDKIADVSTHHKLQTRKDLVLKRKNNGERN